MPWRREFEFDGMWESWQPWTGLPLEERPVRLSWEGPSLAGAGDAGPLCGIALSRSTDVGFGGSPLRRIVADSVPSDTPSTSMSFYRGALASYTFGLDFSRAVVGPWGLVVSTEARSSQAREWNYRDQIQDMFQGAFGRGRNDLPYTGQSPGQDDVQWNFLLVRGDTNSRLDIGWSWVDLQRGVPDPTMTWGGTIKAPDSAEDRRSGEYLHGFWKNDLLRLEGSARLTDEQWNWDGWADTGAPVAVSGSFQREDGEGSARFGDDSWGLGLEAKFRIVDGNRSVPNLPSRVDEDQERFGTFAETRRRAFHARLAGGWTRLSNSENSIDNVWDADGAVEWSDSLWSGSVELSHRAKLPDEELERPDPLLRTAPAAGLLPEKRDLFETRWSLRPFSRWALDASGAILSIQDAIQPERSPVGADTVVERSKAFALTNAGTVLGCSGQLGIGWTGPTFHARTQWSMGWTGLPGQSLSGTRDVRLPTWQSRSSIGWNRLLAQGRMRAQCDVDLRTWGASRSWIGVSGDPLAHAVNLPASSQLDLEVQVTIKTFSINWRLENILDERQTPAAGWTPLGIRAGWGITWSFGG
jgi:hypothetical protein